MWLARLRRRRAARLDVCPRCGSDFVHPVHWEEADEAHMWVRLRCGQCEHSSEGNFRDEVLDRFDRRLDKAAAQIAAEADRLHRHWRTTEADTFAAALDRDLIDGGDFAR